MRDLGGRVFECLRFVLRFLPFPGHTLGVALLFQHLRLLLFDGVVTNLAERCIVVRGPMRQAMVMYSFRQAYFEQPQETIVLRAWGFDDWQRSDKRIDEEASNKKLTWIRGDCSVRKQCTEYDVPLTQLLSGLILFDRGLADVEPPIVQHPFRKSSALRPSGNDGGPPCLLFSPPRNFFSAAVIISSLLLLMPIRSTAALCSVMLSLLGRGHEDSDLRSATCSSAVSLSIDSISQRVHAGGNLWVFGRSHIE